MAKKTYIKIEDSQYLAELVSEVHSQDAWAHDGLLFRIYESDGEVLGCLSVFISITTRAIWNQKEIITPEIRESLFLRILPHIPIAASVEDFKSIYSDCVKLYIDASDTRYLEEEKVQYLRGKESPQDLVESLVYQGKVDDEKVQKDILSYLYESHRENHQALVHTLEMSKALFLEPQTVYRCLNYLSDDGFIKGEEAVGVPGFIVSTITTAGVRFVRSNFQEVRSGTEVIVMGDYVGKDKITTNIRGDNNQNIVKSTVSDSFNMNLVYQKVDALKEGIEKDYQGEDKQVLIGEVDEIKTLASDKKNFPKIRELLGKVLTRTSEFAQIAALGIELFNLFAK